MAIRRYVADADNTITNAFDSDLTTRGTGSNMGAADSLEVFSLYGQTSASSGLTSELSRILIKFPVNNIIVDRAASTIPASGSVSFYLKMYNAEHPYTLARDFKLLVSPVSSSWEEGRGLDMEEYKDITYDTTGSNWTNASGSSSLGIGTWATAGGDYLTAQRNLLTASFPSGWEDLELDISTIVEDWIQSSDGSADKYENYGLGIRLTSSQETSGQPYYTKKFFARTTEFFFKRPVIEARWDSRTKDDRGNFYYSSSLAPGPENLNTLYFYNYVRGRLVNVPGVGAGRILVSLYSGSSSPAGSKLTLYNSKTNITGGYVSTGIYSASVGITASSPPLTRLFDVWHSGSTQYVTSSLAPLILTAYNHAPTFEYVTAITNLKSEYSRQEDARLRLFVREKDWNPNIYSVATSTVPNKTIVSASYKIVRMTDDLDVITYGTGSDKYTYLSYDISGNYFDLDVNLLEAGYAYGVKFSYYNHSIKSWVEQPETFKFRVEE